jgi:hypothetical protein
VIATCANLQYAGQTIGIRPSARNSRRLALQRRVKTLDQAVVAKWLREKAARTCLEDTRTNPLLGKCGDEPAAFSRSCSDTAHAGHLHVADQARRVADAVRLQKLLLCRAAFGDAAVDVLDRAVEPADIGVAVRPGLATGEDRPCLHDEQELLAIGGAFLVFRGAR